MSEHIVAPKSYFKVFYTLMGLLVLTLAAAYVDLGPLNFTVSMAIAAAKAILIVLIFMHVRYDEPLVRIFAAAAFLWLAILIGITLADYLTRGEIYVPGK